MPAQATALETSTSSQAEPQTPAELARHLIEKLNGRDLDAVESYWADDIHEDFTPLRLYRGKRAVRGFFDGLFGAFPDFELAIDTVVGDDESAFVSWRAVGTFTGGPFEGITANGARVDIRGCDHMRFRDGKLYRNTVYYDGNGFARAIGLLPPMDSTAENAMKTVFNTVTSVKKRFRG